MAKSAIVIGFLVVNMALAEFDYCSITKKHTMCLNKVSFSTTTKIYDRLYVDYCFKNVVLDAYKNSRSISPLFSPASAV